MKPTSTTTAAADLLKTGIEEYYCAYCNEEFGKNDPERGEHEDHDGYRKITIFQAFVLDQIKALEAQQTDDTLSPEIKTYRPIAYNDGIGTMREDPQGYWVKGTDVARLMARKDHKGPIA